MIGKKKKNAVYNWDLLPNEKAYLLLKMWGAEHLTSIQSISFAVRKAEQKSCGIQDVRTEMPPYSLPLQSPPLLPLLYLSDLQGAPDLHPLWQRRRAREPGGWGVEGEGINGLEESRASP